MLFERIVSEGLAHYSYLAGDKNQAVIIDPRRDVDVYLERSLQAGMSITNILETHRNEDFFVGSMELAARTGAEVWHADRQWDYQYGEPVQPGQRWKVGRLELEAIKTPGHTPGSMSYLLRDPTGIPSMLFCGDVLFAGEVGRIDLLGPEEEATNARMLYESIFGRILPLGDEIILCPAHGSGSVCGESIAERLWTTIGIERKHNPRLQAEEVEKFAADLLKSQPERPPYFRMMEKVNLEGRPILGFLPDLKPLDPEEFSRLLEISQVLDTRDAIAYGGAHIPGSQFIWIDGLPNYAGWFLGYNRPVILVCEENDCERAVRILVRLGFDNIIGFLAGGMLSWHMSGRKSQSIRTVTSNEICRRLEETDNERKREREQMQILDVRSDKELKKDGKIKGAKHIHITQLASRINEVPKEGSVQIFCGSGLRSMIAASFLEARGWKELTVILGGMAGWREMSCPVEK